MIKRMKEPFHTLMWKASIGYNDSWSQVDPEVLEKFAELIVRECIEQVKPTSHHEAFAQGYLGGVDGLELLDRKVAQIKKHFGV